jgi:hypothetical protein
LGLATTRLDRLVARVLSNPWLALGLLAGGIVSSVLIGAAIYGRGRGLGLDFNVFWRAGHTPLDHIYDANPFDPFIYPPPALFWVRPIGQLPFWPALLLWWAISLSAYGYAARSGTWLLFASPVVVQCLIFGQTSLLLAAVALMAARSTGAIRGALLGAVFSTKPQLVILAPLVLLSRKDWAGLSGLVAIGVFELAASVIVFGVDAWIDWFNALEPFKRTVEGQDLWGVMITPYAYAMRLGISPWPFFAAGGLFAVVAAVRSKRTDLVELTCVTSLLATPYAVANDLAVVLPFALARLLGGGTAGKPSAALIYASAFPPIALAVGALQQTGQRLRGVKPTS